MGAPVRLEKAVSRSNENAAVERREVNALRTGVRRKALNCYPRLSALRSPHIFCEGAFPLMKRGDGNPGAPRALREQGRRSFSFWHVGCLKCESEIRAQKLRVRWLRF